MSSLREIKDRIGSVRSTLKITGAMKLVASAKLRKAQQAALSLRSYEDTIHSILEDLRPQKPGPDSTGSPASVTPDPDLESRSPAAAGSTSAGTDSWERPDFMDRPSVWPDEAPSPRIAVVAVASNSSLCGSFNGNILRRTLDLLRELGVQPAGGSTPPGPATVDVFPIGRRIADGLRRLGIPAAQLPAPSSTAPGSGVPSVTPGSDRESHAAASLNNLVSHPTYEAASALADALAEACDSGRYSRVILVHNHLVTTSRQEVRCETWLPFAFDSSLDGASRQKTPKMSATPVSEQGLPTKSAKNEGMQGLEATDYIVEPSPSAILETMVPQLLRLKLYAMILDSIAAEHAARMIAMQTATDNARDLLDELTLEYNKGRQQQITAEILDIVGGSQQ